MQMQRLATLCINLKHQRSYLNSARIMENKISRIVNWLIDTKAINESDRELYSYALYSISLSFPAIVFSILFGIVVGGIKQSIMIMFPFILMRRFSGGYHTKNPLICLVNSSILLFICIWIAMHGKYSYIVMILAFGAASILCLFSPIDSENRRLDDSEKLHCKKMVTILVTIFLLLSTILELYGYSSYSLCISLSITLTGCLQIPCLLVRLYKKYKV